MSARTDEQRIWELVEEVLATNKLPEEVCADCPELLWEVQRRWKQARRVDSQLEALFPSSDSSSHTAIDKRQFLVDGQLPTIPGYEVEAVLGHGGMGVVYKARHLKLNRPVALKMMLYGALATSSEQARFQREAEAVAALHHPHIVQIYDVGEADGRPYYTMEFLEGGSLAKKLAGKPQPAAAAAAYSVTLAEAVQAAHNAGIVHRDLKPSNILLTADGALKISDFGLARRSDSDQSLTLTTANVGTPSYMAPEQALGQANAFSPAVDIYALGALLYEMLTGRPPFRAETSAETQRQVIAEDPVPPSRLNANVRRDLETICLKCLQKEPARRYESAAALADDLQRFREGRPIRARPVVWAERVWRWSKRNPAGTALVTTALVLAITVGAGGIWFVQQRAERRAEAARHDAELHNEIATALAQAVSFRRGFHFQEARELLEEARQRLEPAGPDDLRRPVAQGLADLNLGEQLDAARSQGAIIVGGKFDPTRPEPFYASAFARAGLGQPGDDTAVVAALVRNSAIREEIIDALDDWASITTDPARRKWLFEIARQADPDPQRNLVRQPDLWDVRGGVAPPMPELKADKISPRMATALARLMQARGLKGITLLAAVQARVPQDFWLTFELNNVMFRIHRLDEALGYARAALALRPQSGLAHSALGAVLLEMGRPDEAIDPCRKAVDIDPEFAESQYNLGEALRSQGKLDEAMGHLREAIAIYPKFTEAYIALAVTLQSKDRLDEAVSLLKEAIRLDPRNAVAHNDLATILRLEDRLDDAIAQLKEAVNIDPRYAVGQFNLGETLWVKGQLEDAIDHLQRAARLDPPDTDTQVFLCDHLYKAACAALLEARNRRVGKPRLDEMAQANLRIQALGWLRVSLNLGIKLVNRGRGQASSIGVWQTEPILANVRDPVELAKLPAAEREQWQRLWADVAAVASNPLEQGRLSAARGDWYRAADGYARSLARSPTDDGHFWFEYAALSLLAGDRPSYDNGCEHLIKACGKVGGPRPYHVARACTLAPDAAGNEELPVGLIEKELQSNARQFWSLTEQGALAYRAGQFQVAAGFAEQSLQADSKPGRAVVNWLWLALANHRLGKPEEARRWLGKAQKWLDQFANGMPSHAEEDLGLHLHNWLEAQILRREAEALISQH